jgi:hypothetical protein
VQVYHANDQLLTEGLLKDGVFVFAFTEVESLKVVVSAGDGHRAEVKIPAANLARYAVCSVVAGLPPEPTSLLRVPVLLPVSARGAPEETPVATVKSKPPPEAAGNNSFSSEGPLADRQTPFPIKDVLIGVGFLLAAAAFLLSVRNAGELRRLRQQQSQRRPKPE